MFTNPDGHVDYMLNVHREDTAVQRLAPWTAARKARVEQDRREAQARQQARLHLTAGVAR